MSTVVPAPNNSINIMALDSTAQFGDLSATQQVAYMKTLGAEAVEAASIERTLRERAQVRKTKVDVSFCVLLNVLFRNETKSLGPNFGSSFDTNHFTQLFFIEKQKKHDAEAELKRLTEASRAAKLALDVHRKRLVKLRDACEKEEQEDEVEGHEVREKWSFLVYLK